MLNPRTVIILMMLICSKSEQLCFGQSGASQESFEQGYQSYMRNQFPIAETHFRRALQSAPTDEDKAFILKFLGISQFMRGDKRSSSETFKEAITLNQKTNIFQGEVLDTSIIPFFNAVKKSTLQAIKNNEKRKPRASKKRLVEDSKNKKKRRRKKRRREREPSETAIAGDKKADKAPRTTSGFRAVHLLPLGVGHFIEQSYVTGSFYGLSQLVAIGIAVGKANDIETEEAENSVIAKSPDYTQEQKREFITRNDAFIEALDNDRIVALGVFGLSYVASVLHGSFMEVPTKFVQSDLAEPTRFAALTNAKDRHISPTFDISPYYDGAKLQVSWSLR